MFGVTDTTQKMGEKERKGKEITEGCEKKERERMRETEEMRKRERERRQKTEERKRKVRERESNSSPVGINDPFVFRSVDRLRLLLAAVPATQNKGK